MMKQTCVILILVLWAGSIQASTQLPDSLTRLLTQKRFDSTYIDRLNNLAFNYLKSDPAIGREIATISADRAKEIEYIRGYSRAVNITGSSYWMVGDYQSALDYYQLSARESGAVNDSTGVAIAFHNMGEVYKKVGDYDRSIEYLTFSLNYDLRRERKHAIALYNIGEAYLYLDKDDIASAYFDKAFSQALLEKDERTIAYAYQGQGLIKARSKAFLPALSYFAKAERLWKEQGEVRSLIQTYQDYADAYLGLKNYRQAQKYLTKATQLAAQVKASDLQIINFQKEAELSAARGDFKKAWSTMICHNQLNDSVYDIRKSEQITRLQTLFETESRDIENRQLKTEQSVKDAQIRFQQFFIIVVSMAMVLAGIVAWVLYKQQRKIAEVNNILSQKNAKIHIQKQEIECQAQAMQNLNDQLSDLNKSLENRIELRTEQLRRQNEKLISYAHANAHQLRAPVVSIIGLLNLIHRINLPASEQIMIEHLLKCGTDLDRITRDLSRALEEEILQPESLEVGDLQT